MGLEIIGEYQDEEASGKSMNGRPGLDQAIRHACKAKAILAVYSLSRLARNTKDAIGISEHLAAKKADLASLHERIDTSSPWGRFFFVLTAALATLEREQLVERTSDAMRRHQSAGRRMGRLDRIPFGFKTKADDPSRIEPDDQEQGTVARMKTLRTEGKSYRQIVSVLDTEGHPRRGKTWQGCHRLVSAILHREGMA
jgi:DNA invertase Pin-like site-specific DNA recombinase